MLKRIFSIIFVIILLISTILPSFAVSAFEVTEFEITANAGMLVSLDTDEVLFEKNADQKIYPASVTVIMTALLMLESDKWDPAGKVAMTDEALKLVLGTGCAVTHTKAGEEFTQRDLLAFVIMTACGDAIYLASSFYGESVEGFVAMMNAKAQELGLTGTNFTNPIGLHDDNHYTTARDIYTLTRYALQNKEFKEAADTDRYPMEATNMSGSRLLSTTNMLIDSTTNYKYEYAHGVKTGYTDEAGRCVVSTATYNEYNYICILMGCPQNKGKRVEFTETAELYRWAFLNFSFKQIAKSNEPVCEMPVKLSFDTDFVPLHFKEPFLTVLPNEADESTLVVKTYLKSETVNAPVKKGTVLGYAEIMYAEKIIGKVDLVAGRNIKESGLLVAADTVKNIFTSIYMKVLFWAAIIAIIVFVVLCIKLNMDRLKKRRVKYKPYKGEKKHEK